MFITADQIRAGRALLDWKQETLADKVGMSKHTISKIENGDTQGSIQTLKKIAEALENAGVEFTEHEGVKKKKGEIRSYKGRDGFIAFYDYVLQVAEQKGGEFCVSNVDEALFDFWLGNSLDGFVKRITAVKNLSYKVLIKEGDYNSAASDYAEYRWLPQKSFGNVPFYLFGDNMAMILFDGHNDVSVYVIEEKAVAEAQKFQFHSIWETATPFPKETES